MTDLKDFVNLIELSSKLKVKRRYCNYMMEISNLEDSDVVHIGKVTFVRKGKLKYGVADYKLSKMKKAESRCFNWDGYFMIVQIAEALGMNSNNLRSSIRSDKPFTEDIVEEVGPVISTNVVGYKIKPYVKDFIDKKYNEVKRIPVGELEESRGKFNEILKLGKSVYVGGRYVGRCN